MDDRDIPKPNSRWVHKNGATYTVAVVTNLKTTRPDEYPPTVVYFSADGCWWSRPLKKWAGSMKLLPEAPKYDYDDNDDPWAGDDMLGASG